jgi:hypothetical protein
MNCFRSTTLLSTPNEESSPATTIAEVDEADTQNNDNENELEIEETINQSLSTVYGADYMTASDVDYCFDDQMVMEEDDIGNVEEEEMEIEPTPSTILSSAAVKAEFQRLLDVLPLSTETDFEVRRVLMKKIKEVDSESIRTAVQRDVRSYFSPV